MNGPGLINHRSSPAQLLKPTVTPESQTHTFLLRTRYSHVIGNSISHSSLVISSPFLAFPYRRSLGARSTDTYKDLRLDTLTACILTPFSIPSAMQEPEFHDLSDDSDYAAASQHQVLTLPQFKYLRYNFVIPSYSLCEIGCEFQLLL
jgi:hypothetical protein